MDKPKSFDDWPNISKNTNIAYHDVLHSFLGIRSTNRKVRMEVLHNLIRG